MADPQQHGPPASGLPRIDCAAVRAHILRSAVTVFDFERIYDGADVQKMIRFVTVSRGNDDVGEWARDWAVRMRAAEPSPADVLLDECHQTLLYLVFTLLDRWENGHITAAALIDRFKGHRFTNILSLAVPLDQAKCLYTMRYVGSERYGMHWVDAPHVARSESWQELLAGVGGRATINERYLWLMEEDGPLAGLNLVNNSELQRLLEPYRNHLLEEEEDEEGDDDEVAMQED